MILLGSGEGSREFFEKVLQERPFQMREVMPGLTWCFEDIWLMFFRREAYELTSYPVQKRKWDLVSFLCGCKDRENSME